MKKILLSLIFLSASYFAFAQEQETLFGSGEVTWGGYGAAETKFSTMNNQMALLVGGRGGVIINHTFTLGIGGYGLVTSHKIDNYKISDPYLTDSIPYLRVGYGGLHLGLAIEPNRLVHITGGVLIGAGGAAYTREYTYNHWENDHNWKTYNSSAFFVLEPHIGVELNLTNFMRLEASGTYRYVSGLDLPVTSNSDIAGPSGTISIKFGKF